MDASKPTPPPDVKLKRWSNTTKLIVGLSIVAILALLLVQLRSWMGVSILNFIIAYLNYPLASLLHNRLKLPGWLA